MATKLSTQIRNWIEKESHKKHPELAINETKQLSTGQYYDLQIPGFRFCLILQELKDHTKMNWIFHEDLTENEQSYWKHTYEFKLNNEMGKYFIGKLQIKNIKNQEPIKTIMNRKVNTLRIFKKDLKWIIIMGKQRFQQ